MPDICVCACYPYYLVENFIHADAQTDGEDTTSKIKAHTITKELQQRGVVVDAVMISKCRG